jgi:hypothetical protein
VELAKYSIGIGDRFGFEGSAQLRALQKLEALGIPVVPVWNKSNREHQIIGTSPDDTRRAADQAVKACQWNGPYFVDADHISLGTVDRFIASSDFFTIDVAESIGKPAPRRSVDSFMRTMSPFRGTLHIPRMQRPLEVTDELLTQTARKYLRAVEEAGGVYRHIAARRGAANFVTEISVDEASAPQSPAELFFILGAIAYAGIPLQTIAPKFTGEFLKGIDYVGDISTFTREFEDDLAVIAHAVDVFNLPRSLKLSVHSGSDKFSLYPVIHRVLRAFDVGLHLKTAGTTWLEEVIGLASAGGAGLMLAKEIYCQSFNRFHELAAPYRAVIAIDEARLPSPEFVNSWTAIEYVEALQHDQSCKSYNIHFRQLLHIGYKVAAEMHERFTELLSVERAGVEQNVTTNIYERHLRPLFLGGAAHQQEGSSRDREPLVARPDAAE